MRATSHDSLRTRVVTLVGTPKPQPQDTCFHCGKSTVLGRMRGTIAGRLVTSCFRNECAEALRVALEKELASDA